ncbi:hypothetical protein [Aurantibacillus circumpalustris]|uniref:hypothetical protein n=1 Tax=Aurantibacillus circumpalustris TaxID=3036359 RepID=UPI00295ADD24|nr:hypothetical protein [Aurantibacillus circumpalustris]
MKNDKSNNFEEHLINGKSFHWIEDSGESIDSFMEKATKSITPIYNYKYLIIAVIHNNDVTHYDKADLYVACKGKLELANEFIRLSEQEYLCKVDKLDIALIQRLRNTEDE